MMYPRSSARPIYLTTGVLGMLGLAGVIVMLIAMADVPRQSYYLLIAAFGLLIVALAGALAVLLATNTRRPWGIDPNFGPHSPAYRREADEAIQSARSAASRHAVQLPDGLGYGRRQSDDTTVVRRLASATECDERPQPPKFERPAWASEMLPPSFREEPRAGPPPELEAAPLTEIPLDQLDLAPAVPDTSGQGAERNGEHPGAHQRPIEQG
jgi:hypothetical protein